MRRRKVRFLGDGREWRLPGLLYVDDGYMWSVEGVSDGDGGTVC